MKRFLLSQSNNSKWIDWHCHKKHHANMTKKVKCRSISKDEVTRADVYAYVYICICVCMHMCNEIMMADWTIKDNAYVWHDQLHVFLFSSVWRTWKAQTLETCCVTPKYCLSLYLETLNHYCLFIQRQYESTPLTLFHLYIYIYNIYIYI